MDSFTHIAFGACIGEALLGKKLGKKAMIWGALAQSIPDIDFVASFWMDTSSDLLAHRGFTHSILFGLLATPIMAMIAERWHRPHNIRFNQYLIFFFTEIFVHLALDGFNAYGTGYLEPFSHQRFSLNTIFVADPLFTLPLAIAITMLIYLNRQSPKRTFWWKFGILSCTFYLGYCLVNKAVIDRDVRNSLSEQNIKYDQYFTTPTALNSWLWFVVAGNDSGFYIGHRSVFDRHDVNLRFVPRNEYLLDEAEDHESVQKLKRFSQGFYTAELWQDTLVFNDLRFGQIRGWDRPDGKFVFHYFLRDSTDNHLVVQRGRFAGWDRGVANSLLTRIKGF
jgi:inner membrane protein